MFYTTCQKQFPTSYEKVFSNYAANLQENNYLEMSYHQIYNATL